MGQTFCSCINNLYVYTFFGSFPFFTEVLVGAVLRRPNSARIVTSTIFLTSTIFGIFATVVAKNKFSQRRYLCDDRRKPSINIKDAKIRSLVTVYDNRRKPATACDGRGRCRPSNLCIYLRSADLTAAYRRWFAAAVGTDTLTLTLRLGSGFWLGLMVKIP